MEGLGSSRPPGESIGVVVSMIEMDHDEWVEEVLDDGIVGMMNVQFDNRFAYKSNWQDSISDHAY